MAMVSMAHSCQGWRADQKHPSIHLSQEKCCWRPPITTEKQQMHLDATSTPCSTLKHPKHARSSICWAFSTSYVAHPVTSPKLMAQA